MVDDEKIVFLVNDRILLNCACVYSRCRMVKGSRSIVIYLNLFCILWDQNIKLCLKRGVADVDGGEGPLC